MAKTNLLINNFNTGEISELINATRSDISKYLSACKTLENACPLVEGGAKKMPGTYYAGLSKNGGPLGTPTIGKSLLYPFQFSTAQGLVAEFFANGVRIWEKGGLVEDPSFSSNPYDPATTYAANSLVNVGDYATITFGSGAILYIASQYGPWLAKKVPISVGWNGSDDLSVTVTGTLPNQGISILLASTTASKNSAAAIQAAIRTLIGLNSPNNNYIDLTQWTVTGNTAYNTSPPTGASSISLLASTNFSKIFTGGGITDYQAELDFSNSASLLIDMYVAGSSPDLDGAPLAVGFNGSDALSVSQANGGILILLATTTASKNSAVAILVALNALAISLVNSVQGNSVYNSDPPTTAIPPTVGVFYPDSSGGAYKATIGSLTGIFPPVSPIRWSLLTSGPVLEVTTPYQEEDLFDLEFVQSADVLYIFHPDYPPASLSRYAASIWVYALPSFSGTQELATTGYLSLAQSIEVISKSYPAIVYVSSIAQPFNNGDRIYINQVGGMEQVNLGQFIVSSMTAYGGAGSGVWAFNIADPDSGTLINSTLWPDYLGGGFAVKVIPLFNTPGDYPACGTLFQQRLCLAGFLNDPNKINGSVQADYPDFIADPNADDHAFQFTLVSQKVDQIRRIIGGPNGLLLGTVGGIWSMNGPNGQSLSPTNVDAIKQTMIGVGNLEPQLANDSVIWVSRSARIVYFLVYNFMSNQWDNYDLTRLARHITIGNSVATSGIIQTAFQAEPYPIFWAVRKDGQLLGLVFNKQDQVFAWFRVKMDGLVESVACISQDNDEDQVWVVVNRTINGVSQRFVEYFMPQELFGQLNNAFFVHAGLQWQGVGPVLITAITNANPCKVTAPDHGLSTAMKVQITSVKGMTQINQDPASAYTVTVIDDDNFTLNGINSTGWGTYTSGGSVAQVTNTVSGLSYLQGKTAVAVGDGALIFNDVVPSNGIVVFPYYVNLITIGLPYTTTIEPANPIIGSQQTSSKGEKQKISDIDVSVYQSIGGKYGSDPSDPTTLYDLLYGPGTQGQKPQMVTQDDINVDFPGDWDDKTRFCIVHDLPFPFTLRSVSVKISMNPS